MRRWLLPGTHPELNLDKPPLDEISQSLKDHRTDPGPPLWLLAFRLLRAIQSGIWTAKSDWTGLVPGVGNTLVAWAAQRVFISRSRRGSPSTSRPSSRK